MQQYINYSFILDIAKYQKKNKNKYTILDKIKELK